MPDLSGRIIDGMARASVCLSTNLVNTIQTEPFQLGPSNLVYILLMTKGQHILLFKVRGQRSRSHTKHCCFKLVNMIQTEPF